MFPMMKVRKVLRLLNENEKAWVEMHDGGVFHGYITGYAPMYIIKRLAKDGCKECAEFLEATDEN